MTLKHIVIVTDAWAPQMNGVVRTYEELIPELEKLGIQTHLITPQEYRSIPAPRYPEIRLAIFAGGSVRRRLTALQREGKMNALHIATEGPLGLAARGWARKHKRPYMTAYHTRFPEYLNILLKIPVKWGYVFERFFHKYAEQILVPTQSMCDVLTLHGLKNLEIWTRGVPSFFRTYEDVHAPDLEGLQKPVALYFGRLSKEKGVEDVLRFPKFGWQGSVVVVGDGPYRAELEATYGSDKVRFIGKKFGEELGQYVAAADVFVFPSQTDTFGRVLIESLACGTPVAAYSVEGPKDVIGAHCPAGVLAENTQPESLVKAAQKAVILDAEKGIEWVQKHYTLQLMTQQFVDAAEKCALKSQK